jgi:hypothetical protein
MTLSRVLILASSFLMATAGAVAQSGGQTEQPAQPPAQPAAILTADQLKAAGKRYFRDTAELPMLQTMQFSAFDPSGHTRKTGKLTMEYLFKGYNPRTESGNARVSGHVSMWSVMRGNKMVKISLNSANWTMQAGIVARDFNGSTFEARTLADQDGWALAKLVPKGPCSSVVMKKNAEYYLPDGEFCASSEFQLDHDLRFQKSSYEVLGLPAAVKIDPFGECTLMRYYAEVEFQIFTMPGEKEPFLLPQRVTTTLETNKGKVVIASVYAPKIAQQGSSK